MTEIILGCSYTYGNSLELDCEEKPAWRIVFPCDDGETQRLISCERHLTGLVRGLAQTYGSLKISLEELK